MCAEAQKKNQAIEKSIRSSALLETNEALKTATSAVADSLAEIERERTALILNVSDLFRNDEQV